MASEYTPPTISNYNDNPAPDDGTEVTDNEITWAKIKDELTDPVYVYSDAINAAVAASMALIDTDAEGTFSNNANGNPNVSDASFTVSSLTVATWAEIGPTGATNAWPALDDVPADADWIEVKTYIKATNTGTSAIATLYARASGADDEAIGGDNMIAQAWIEDGDSDSKVATNVTYAKIPISTGTLFDVHYTETGTAAPIFIFLTGYGTNP